MEKAKQGKIRRNTRVTSEKVREQHERSAKYAPLVVNGISDGKFTRIEPGGQMDKLDIDPTYQRGETNMIGVIVRAVQLGGAVLDPITVCKRPWDTLHPNKLWIVDGHQRVCALQQLKKSIPAMIHESVSVEAERQFFLALNAKRTQSANVIVHAWAGLSGEMLRNANVDMSHPLCGRLCFTQGGARGRLISPMQIVAGAWRAAVGGASTPQSFKMLAMLDNAMRDSTQRARVEHYLRLIGLVFPVGGLGRPVALAFGVVCFNRWKTPSSIDLPRLAILEKLAAVKWSEVVPTASEKYVPVYVETVNRYWK